MMHGQAYAKYFYWVDATQIEAILDTVKSWLQLQSIPRARQRPCEALNPTFPVIHLPPETWSATCFRQASWFRTSKLKEKHLLVSNSTLPIPLAILSGKITKITGQNVPAISRAQYVSLLETPAFKKRAPPEWFHLLDREIPVFKSFLDKIGVYIDLDEFLEKHSANHAHFLQPMENMLLTIEHEDEQIPCSLFPSSFICSACMELFGVLGSHLRKKAVKNCPGLKYAPLGLDEFFLVEISKD
ncbi:MAG: hypothetical protein Q6353_007305, partial [Candidatus Sigynarchaeum springense]